MPERSTILDLAPAPGNPRNSEGAFLDLKDGRILFAYSRYVGSSADDHAYAEIAGIFSSDGGKTFSEPRILAKPESASDSEPEETNCMSVSLMRMRNGDIGLFYLVKHRGVSSEYVLRRSSDEGETWSEPIRCVSPLYRGYYVVNNDRVLRCENGRLIVPAAWHPSTMLYHNQPDHVDGRSTVVFCASDDDGYTWRQVSDQVGLPGGGHTNTGLQEPGITELGGGTLYAYFRTDLGRQYESVSIDGGESWFAPRPSGFTAPESPLLIKKNPYSGKYIAVWNPVPGYPGKAHHDSKTGPWTGGRNPLVMAESSDGVHFISPQVLEDNPDAGFCYPAMHFTGEKSMLLAYCCGGVEASDASCLVRTRISTVNW